MNSKNLHIDHIETTLLEIDEIQNLFNKHTEITSASMMLFDTDNSVQTKELDLRKNTKLKQIYFEITAYDENNGIDDSIKFKFNTKIQTELAIKDETGVGALHIESYGNHNIVTKIIIEDDNKGEDGLHNIKECLYGGGWAHRFTNNAKSTCR